MDVPSKTRLRDQGIQVQAKFRELTQHALLTERGSFAGYQEAADRFQLWASNLGLYQTGHASLDYRFQDAPKLDHFTEQLLNQLREDVSTVLDFLDTSRDAPQQSDDNASESSRSSGSSASDSEPFDQVALETIIEYLDKLYRIASRIQSSKARIGMDKAKKFRKTFRGDDNDPDGNDLIESFRDFDKMHIEEYILEQRRCNREQQGLDRNCAPLIDTWSENTTHLIQNLLHANQLRRQQFGYWRERYEKNVVVPTRVSLYRDAAPTERDIHRWLPVDKAREVEDSSQRLPPDPVPSTTTVTKLSRGLDLKEDDIRSTVSSSAFTAAVDESFEVPSLPPDVQKLSNFECPYCFYLCSKKQSKGRSWINHVIHDLRPYVCTRSCPQSRQLYDNYAAWAEHEASHETALESLVSTSVDDIKLTCVICEEKNISLQHVAEHLRHIALFALPRSTQYKDRNGSEGTSARADDASHHSRQSITSSKKSPVISDHQQDPDMKIETNKSMQALSMETLEDLNRANEQDQKLNDLEVIDEDTGIGLMQAYTQLDQGHVDEYMRRQRRNVLGFSAIIEDFDAETRILAERLAKANSFRRRKFLHWRTRPHDQQREKASSFPLPPRSVYPLQIPEPSGVHSFSSDIFECPYCFRSFPGGLSLGKAWQGHVLQDLAPYVCIEVPCPHLADVLFSDFDHWSTHMKTHGTEEPAPCRFCGKQNMTLTHVAGHLEELALFALPRTTEGEDEEEDSGGTDFAVHPVSEGRSSPRSIVLDTTDGYHDNDALPVMSPPQSLSSKNPPTTLKSLPKFLHRCIVPDCFERNRDFWPERQDRDKHAFAQHNIIGTKSDVRVFFCASCPFNRFGVRNFWDDTESTMIAHAQDQHPDLDLAELLTKSTKRLQDLYQPERDRVVERFKLCPPPVRLDGFEGVEANHVSELPSGPWNPYNAFGREGPRGPAASMRVSLKRNSEPALFHTGGFDAEGVLSRSPPRREFIAVPTVESPLPDNSSKTPPADAPNQLEGTPSSPEERQHPPLPPPITKYVPRSRRDRLDVVQHMFEDDAWEGWEHTAETQAGESEETEQD